MTANTWGVSVTANNQNAYGCKVGPGLKGRPLFIKDGFVRNDGGLTGDMHFQGTMSADGRATLRDGYGRIIILKIERDGRAVGMSSSGCNVIGAWQKQNQAPSGAAPPGIARRGATAIFATGQDG